MKNTFSLFLALLLLISLFPVSASAEKAQSFSGFYQVEVNDTSSGSVSLSFLDTDGTEVDADSALLGQITVPDVYANASQISLTATAETGEEIAVLLLTDNSGVPTQDNLVYIDESAAVAESATFRFSADWAAGTTYTVYISTGTGIIAIASFCYEDSFLPDETLRLTHQTAALTGYNGDSASANVTATGGTEPYAYQWEKLSSGGDEWAAIEGADSASVTILLQDEDQGAQLRCLVTDSAGAQVTSKTMPVSLVVGLKLVTESEEYTVNGRGTLTARLSRLTGASLPLTWYSSDESVASLSHCNNNGAQIHALHTGEATITATTADGYSSSVTLTVQPGEAMIRILPDPMPDETLTGTNFTGVAEDGALTELISDSDSYALTINQAAETRSFSVSAELIRADGTATAMRGAALSWSTSDKSIATVSLDSGKPEIVVKANVTGACTITATSYNGAKAGTIAVYVRDYVPRYEASSLKLDSQKAGSASLNVIESYENLIVQAEVLEKDSSGIWSISPNLTADYSHETQQLTLRAVQVLKNGTYKVQVRLTCENSESYTQNITVTIKNTSPQITFTKTTLYTALQNAAVTLHASAKAETVSALLLSPATTAFTGSFDEGTGALTLMPTGPVTGSSVKATVLVELEGYAFPVEKAETFTVSKVLPAAKLSSYSVALYGKLPEHTDSVSLTLSACAETPDEVQIKIPAKAEGKITLTYENGTVTAVLTDTALAAGTYSCTLTPVVDGQACKTVTLRVQVKNDAPKLTLSSTRVLLNLRAPEGTGSLTAKISPTIGAETISNITFTSTAKEGSSTWNNAQLITFTTSTDETTGAISVTAALNGKPGIGYYTFRMDVVLNSSAGERTVSAQFQVAAHGNQPQITLKQSGTLDLLVPQNGITYTVTKITRTESPVASVALAGKCAYLFTIQMAQPDTSGHQRFLVKLNPAADVSKGRTYPVILQLTLTNGEVISVSRNLTVKQSSLTLNASLTSQTVYQSQSRSRTLIYIISAKKPAGAALSAENCTIAGILPWQSALVNAASNLTITTQADGTLRVAVTIPDTSKLVAGKTYTLPLQITADGAAAGTKVTKITLTLKVKK